MGRNGLENKKTGFNPGPLSCVPSGLVIVMALVLFAGPLTGCTTAPGGNVAHDEMRKLQAQREKMVETQILERGISDERVVRAMLKIPRHRFVPQLMKWGAYEDSPLLLGEGQSMFRPYMVALMTERLRLGTQDRVLEIGTGSGYQTAVLAEIVKNVYSVEILEHHARKAENLLVELGYSNIRVRLADGYQGWPAEAPFDAIVVNCCPDHIPQPLVDQLKVGGRMVIPVKKLQGAQELVLITKTGEGLEKETVTPGTFKSMTGEGVKGHHEDVYFRSKRIRMVEQQISARGVRDPRVIGAMMKVPRHLFVPVTLQGSAYGDFPLPIGEGQTISQPYMVAFMTEKVQVGRGDRVLEIGTGSGYHAAVLAELVDDVYTVEIVESLGRRAESLLNKIGYDNVHVRVGDGYKGWGAAAPFDAIIVTCAPDHIPLPLINQLKFGGKMIIPVGDRDSGQELFFVRKTADGLIREAVYPVRFVANEGADQ